MIFDNVRVITSGSQTETFEQIFRITDKDVMIGISFPRYSSMSVEAMDFARQGALTQLQSRTVWFLLLLECRFRAYCKKRYGVNCRLTCCTVKPYHALIVATVLKKKDEVSDTFRRLELVWNRDGVYTNRDREIMGNIEDDDK